MEMMKREKNGGAPVPEEDEGAPPFQQAGA
jgi:hypothetical protein